MPLGLASSFAPDFQQPLLFSPRAIISAFFENGSVVRSSRSVVEVLESSRAGIRRLVGFPSQTGTRAIHSNSNFKHASVREKVGTNIDAK
jgi:hypothetical protein